MNEWIECNLPWQVRLEWPETPAFPNMDARVRTQWGFTYEELEKQFFSGDYQYVTEHPFFREFEEIREELEREHSEEVVKQKLQLHPSVAVQTVLAFRGIRKSMSNWIDEQPEVIAWVEECNQINAVHREAEGKLSFCGRKLNQAGTLIELEEDGRKFQMMIGTINELGGSCDDCRGISDDSVILRYKVLWNGSDS